MIGIGFDKLDELSEGVFYVDERRRIIFWNKGAEEITGYLKSECVGRMCYDNILRHADGYGRELCRTDCPMQKTLKDGKPRELDAFLLSKNGERVPCTVNIKPLYDSTGAIRGATENFSIR
ncbi:PAS domain-containing protein [Geovibrio ferrireducens]|uniref:PAS domain-containing protein n=1 Tax=Geovibrio ferrireducens TaxID=46201 RepID=UPI002246FBC4|nr:PAS domain-containing protein [Geovibrio ferrireducens]